MPDKRTVSPPSTRRVRTPKTKTVRRDCATNSQPAKKVHLRLRRSFRKWHIHLVRSMVERYSESTLPYHRMKTATPVIIDPRRALSAVHAHQPITVLHEPSEIMDNNKLGRWVWDDSTVGDGDAPTMEGSSGSIDKPASVVEAEFPSPASSADVETQNLRRQFRIQQIASSAQQACLEETPQRALLSKLLNDLIEPIGCRIGFIGVVHTENGEKLVKGVASSTTYSEQSEAFQFNEHIKLKGSCFDGNASNALLTVPFDIDDTESGVLAVGLPIAGSFSQTETKLLKPIAETCGVILRAFNKRRAAETRIQETQDRLETENDELLRINNRVTKASAAQLQHFACMSHEIRTPLNCIVGLSSLLLEDSSMTPKQTESMNMIVASGDLLSRVVNDVLDYSKLTSGNVDIEIKQTNLQETLSNLVFSLEMRAQTKNITIRTDYACDVPEFLKTDSRRLQQVLYNLFGNAIKFSKEGSVIDFKICLAESTDNEYSTDEDNASLSWTPSDDEDNFELTSSVPKPKRMLRFKVKDYGHGIRREDFGRIFRPFLQADGDTERVYGGTGLGLAITSKLVQGLGGRISVNSVFGEWSEFCVDLPIDGVANIPALSSMLEKGTVLFVGDEESSSYVRPIFDEYDVSHEMFGNMQQLEQKVSTQGFLDNERFYVCLVQEDLYDNDSFQLLDNLSTNALLTYGPQLLIKESRDHFRSLRQVLPSVLMNVMSHYVNTPTTMKKSTSASLLSNVVVVPHTTLRVLIAEDNIINQKVLHRILARLGITNITIAQNGQEAVDCEAAEPFDVVLMDMQMPVMNGVEACKHIVSRDDTNSHPRALVMFASAHVSDRFMLECKDAGAIGFMPKPFNISEVEKCLERIQTILAEQA